MMATTKWATNTPIFYRLFLASICVAIIPGVIIALLGIDYIQTFRTRSQAVQASTNAINLATTQLADLQHLNADLTSLHAEKFVTTNAPGIKNKNINDIENNLYNEIALLRNKFNLQIREYQQKYLITTSDTMQSVRSLLSSNSSFTSITQQQQKMLDQIVNHEWQDYVQVQDQDLQELRSSNRVVNQGQLPAVNSKYTPLEHDWIQIVGVTEIVGDRVAEVSATQLDNLLVATIIAIVCVLLVVGVVGYIINFTIGRPLRQMSLVARRIGQGDTNARASVRGGDEIALVAASINTMVDNIVHLIQETQAQRASLQSWIDKLVGEVSGIGSGNLWVQAEVTSSPLGVLAASFNYMVRQLSILVVRVKTSANAVKHSTGVVHQLMAQLVKTSDMQSRQINESEKELGAMAASSRQIAHRADMLFNASKEEQLLISKGRMSVKRATEAMQHMHENVQETASKVKKLDERSHEIDKLLTVILGIAQQTNVLAHNAVAQSMLVGENGKGFSAVAADIQRLAERVKKQVSSIAEIVLTVREDIRQTSAAMRETEQKCAIGTLLTQNTGSSLEAIFASVERQAEQISSINQMTVQQLHAFSSVEHTIKNISSSAQQVHAQARETAQYVEYQAQLVEELRRSVEVFELRERNSRDYPALQGNRKLSLRSLSTSHTEASRTPKSNSGL